tara:strand:+ start:1665 stop:3044 length:1380 start_codon:yes stop_codon:yes gene_type:complete
MPITLEVGYFNSFYVKRIADVPYGLQKTGTSAWTAPSSTTIEEDWYIEESRIRGGYNNTSTDLGIKAYIVEDNDAQQHLANSLIYSGPLNSRTGINQTNQFSSAEEITRSVDPINGSIQKLYAEDTNLIIFQERKVNRALINKDAIYSAEGNPITTSTNLVIGQIVSYLGEFGISQNPESFAVYGYQKYFVDKNRNAVLRLSRDGITEISSYGMQNFFRENLLNVAPAGKIVGSYDVYNKNYTLSLQNYNISSSAFQTLSFDESINGWSSFYSYKPDWGFSSNGNFFTTNKANVYKHYDNSAPRASFYGGGTNPSIIEFVINPDPTRIKTFKTVNYEGSNGWKISYINSEETQPVLDVDNQWVSVMDQSSQIYSYEEGAYVENNIQYRAGFDRKQNEYVAAIKNSAAENTGDVLPGQVLIGSAASGLKGHYLNVYMRTDTTTDLGGLKELFAVGATYGR